ncbi:type II toxin-antitoxin system RelE/ParE family toxin [Salegentibacter sp.]|uniref:type II toxin-antitoxin system RelE/ParE family toxin n=1 Tax=Salegentibacter sp. TaxID=1903072 RepID=UPI003565556C
MARKIVWSTAANNDLLEILEYWNLRNQSKTYSKRLLKEFNLIIKLLQKFPELGIKTNRKNLRIKIFKAYKIFYEIGEYSIVILRIWDTRQNPNKLKI